MKFRHQPKGSAGLEIRSLVLSEGVGGENPAKTTSQAEEMIQVSMGVENTLE